MKPTQPQAPTPERAEDRRVLVVVNRGSGTVRSLGEDRVRQQLESGFAGHGKTEIVLVAPSGINARIDTAITDRSHDVIVVGGGDGSISAVAARLVGTGIALGVLPLGTMNMVAKSIDLSLSLDGAISQLAGGRIGNVDVGRVNGQVFLHQVSFGLQPRMVRIRERIGYRSRLTKIISTSLAVVTVLARPRPIRAIGVLDGSVVRLRLPALAISNNLYRDDRPAVPAGLEGGELGVYQVRAARWHQYVRLAFAALKGTWRHEDTVKAQPAQHVRLEFKRRLRKPRMLASIDGELAYLTSPVDITIEPGVLRMVLPATPGDP